VEDLEPAEGGENQIGQQSKIPFSVFKEGPLLAESGPSILAIFRHLNVRYWEKRTLGVVCTETERMGNYVYREKR